MNVTLVKELRNKTNAGMMDCKKALTEADGDLEEAVQILRKKGIVKAAKKADRDANEGLITAMVVANGQTGVIVEVNCETDFVARNEAFVELTQKVVEAVVTGDASQFDAEGLLQTGSLLDAVSTLVKESVITLGENLNFARASRFDANNGLVGSYIHMGGKIGVLIDVEGFAEGAEETLKDVCMHIVASNPTYLQRDEISNEVLEKEKDVVSAQNENKPAEILEKILNGKLEKYFADNCLMEQGFIKDPDRKIKDVLGSLTIRRFVRFQLGT